MFLFKISNHKKKLKNYKLIFRNIYSFFCSYNFYNITPWFHVMSWSFNSFKINYFLVIFYKFSLKIQILTSFEWFGRSTTLVTQAKNKYFCIYPKIDLFIKEKQKKFIKIRLWCCAIAWSQFLIKIKL